MVGNRDTYRERAQQLNLSRTGSWCAVPGAHHFRPCGLCCAVHTLPAAEREHVLEPAVGSSWDAARWRVDTRRPGRGMMSSRGLFKEHEFGPSKADHVISVSDFGAHPGNRQSGMNPRTVPGARGLHALPLGSVVLSRVDAKGLATLQSGMCGRHSLLLSVCRSCHSGTSVARDLQRFERTGRPRQSRQRKC